MDNVILVQGYGDFDMPYIIGVGTDEFRAEKILKRYLKDKSYSPLKIKEVKPGKFKDLNNNNGEPFDYFLKSIKVNTVL